MHVQTVAVISSIRLNWPPSVSVGFRFFNLATFKLTAVRPECFLTRQGGSGDGGDGGGGGDGGDGGADDSADGGSEHARAMARTVARQCGFHSK